MNLLKDNIYYIGLNDYITDIFESQYPIPHGVSYNSYIIMDEKIAIMDTVDIRFAGIWLDNIKEVLNDKIPDYLVVSHMEPDHSASIEKLVELYPSITLVGNAKTFTMIKAFFPNLNTKQLVVKEYDKLDLGSHKLTFVFAPMVHWPEVMVEYDEYSKILFSADGFGKFGALDYDETWEDEARRYYIGIVGKYGAQVQQLLKKATTLDIEMICPLHGPILKDNLGYYLDLYNKWSSYTSEVDGAVILYASIYGNTKEACEILYNELKSQGKNVVIYDLAREDIFKCVAEAFKYSKLILASPTYNGIAFPIVSTLIKKLADRNYQNKTVGFIENYTWAAMAKKSMLEGFEKCKNITFIEKEIKINAKVKENNINDIKELANIL